MHKEVQGKNSKEQMKFLQDCCARLYTKHCFIYAAVNDALRKKDQSKAHLLGPFAHVLYSYVGQRIHRIVLNI